MVALQWPISKLVVRHPPPLGGSSPQISISDYDIYIINILIMGKPWWHIDLSKGESESLPHLGGKILSWKYFWTTYRRNLELWLTEIIYFLRIFRYIKHNFSEIWQNIDVNLMCIFKNFDQVKFFRNFLKIHFKKSKNRHIAYWKTFKNFLMG